MAGNFKKLMKNPYVMNLLLAIVVFCVLVYSVLAWLGVYTHHNEAVTVPDVVGLQIEDAAPIIEHNFLRFNVIDSVFSRKVKPGAIVDVVPPVGSKVKEGRIIFITVNASSAETAPVPDVTDLSNRQALALLQSRGFDNVQVQYVPGDYKDLALGVASEEGMLRPGERVALTTPLILKVSSGEAVPDTTDTVSGEVDNDAEKWF